MIKQLKVCVIAAGICLVASAAGAQQIVHALSGTVESVNPKIKMTEVTTDDGSSGHFEWKKSDLAVEFDKNVKADAVDADQFNKKGDHVIVFYVGDGQVRTIVAVHDLGEGPIEKTTGTVVKLDRHGRLLTITNSKGVEETFHLDPKTVGDTTNGVAEGLKFDFSKGDPVVVTAVASGGSATALLIAPRM